MSNFYLDQIVGVELIIKKKKIIEIFNYLIKTCP